MLDNEERDYSDSGRGERFSGFCRGVASLTLGAFLVSCASSPVVDNISNYNEQREERAVKKNSKKTNFNYILKMIKRADSLENSLVSDKNRWAAQKSALAHVDEDEEFEEPQWQKFYGFPDNEENYKKLIPTEKPEEKKVGSWSVFSQSDELKSQEKMKEIDSLSKITVMDTVETVVNADVPEGLDRFSVSIYTKGSTREVLTDVEFSKKEEPDKTNIRERIESNILSRSNIFVCPDEDSESSKRFAEKFLARNVDEVYDNLVSGILPPDFYHIVIGASLRNVKDFPNDKDFLPEAFLAESVILMQHIERGDRPVSVYYSKLSPGNLRDTWVGFKNVGRDVGSFFTGFSEKDKQHHNIFEFAFGKKHQELMEPYRSDSERLRDSYMSGLKESYKLNPIDIADWLEDHSGKLVDREEYSGSKNRRWWSLRNPNKEFPVDVTHGRFYPVFDDVKHEALYYWFSYGEPISRIQPVRVGDKTCFFVGKERYVKELTQILNKDNAQNFDSTVKYVSLETMGLAKENGVHYGPFIYPDVLGVVASVYDPRTNEWVGVNDQLRVKEFNKKNVVNIAVSGIKGVYKLGRKTLGIVPGF